MPRPGKRARETGRAMVTVLGPECRLWLAAAEGPESECADRDVREVPLAAVSGARGFPAWSAVHGLLRAGGAFGRPVSARRADTRRGLRIRLVSAEQNVCQPRALQRLPRAAFAQTEVRRQSAVFAVPRSYKVRHDGAPSSQGGYARRAVHQLPHGIAAVYGHRRTARSQFPHTATRLIEATRHDERV